MSDFRGKTAVVTGASRGIGAATAIALAQGGAAHIVIHYNSYPDGAEEVLAAVRNVGATAESIQADLGRSEGIQTFIQSLHEMSPDVDILVNNAGSLVKRAALLEYDEGLFDTVMNLNVKSVYLISQAVVPGMAQRGGGIIVNVSSIAARNGGGPGATVYAAAKAAVSCMTKGMARELAPKGIRVNAISPGTVDNHFHETFSTKEMLEGVVRNTPAGRLATNEEMAGAILFLCSKQAAYIIGQTVELNGGMYMV
jgi:3-oxoacyl-[acyl-carrier protein] reductase